MTTTECYRMLKRAEYRLVAWCPECRLYIEPYSGPRNRCLMDCDIRVASEKSVFGMPEVALGMVPGWWASVRAPLYMPIGKALEYLLTGNNFDVWEAEKMGLVNYVLPSAEVMPKAEEIAHKINENGPLAVRGIKEAMYRVFSSPLPEAARLEDTFSFITSHSEDVKEGVRAFWEKRKPKYKGR